MIKSIRWHNPWLIALLLLAPLCIATLASDYAAPSDPGPSKGCQLAPRGWAPSLDLARSYLERKLSAETNPSQHELVKASQTLADLSDAQLFVAYVRLMQTLNLTGQTKLLAEQTKWLDGRTARARAAVVSKGGSLEPLEYSGAFRLITDQRLTELRERLRRQSVSTAEKERHRP